MSERRRREFTAECKRETVGPIASSGRTIRQVADDLGLGLSTLTRRKRERRNVEVATTPNLDVTNELAKLRKENDILKQTWDLLKKAAAFFVKETSR